MSEAANSIVMNADSAQDMLQQPEGVEEIRKDRKNKLAAALRLFGKLGFDEGVAGHITVRDPELTDHFWVNPMGKSFKQMTVSDLLLVSHTGEVVEGSGLLNGAAFTIHSQIHMSNPDITAAAHSHSVYGKAFSALGKTLDPLTQDSCAFYDDHVLFDDFSGVVLDNTEGEKIAAALGDRKGCYFAKPRSAHRRRQHRCGRLVVYHHGAQLPGTIDGRGRRHTKADRA